ncbi:MAG: L-threonine 3-dehydrogenase [Acidimicrobiia bacterium]|nr:L-threonine 3-dehydrogenase [Acidimicrobiia bacterium]NNL69094.1 L-threonine 3-dehydrogenase [Acidimicrobiia bacterium]
MRALVKSADRPGLDLTDIPGPVPGPNDVVIDVRVTSICGTDLHIFDWDEWARRTVPIGIAVGHEFAGVVSAIGDEVTGLTVGDRVSAEGHITCGHCRNCRAGKRHYCRNASGIGVHRAGAFADQVLVPAGNVFPLPDDVSDEIGSILDPLGNATHTALAFDLVGEDVLITGAGPIGLMATAIARHIGARYIVVTDINDYRLALADRLGADRAVHVGETPLETIEAELGMVEGFDVGLEMSGAPAALADMLRTINHGAHIALLGIPSGPFEIDWNQVIFKGLTLKGIYGRRMFETWYKMTSMLHSGLDISAVITHRFPAEEYEAAFAAVREGRTGKVILDWGRASPGMRG